MRYYQDLLAMIPIIMQSKKITMDRAGYLNSAYAFAFKEFGQPIELSHCKGWVIERKIPNFDAVDAMGCYPLFMCEDWSSLHLDLQRIDRNWVTLALVTDPFGNYSPEYLKRCFPDVMIPFKQHYVVDLKQIPSNFIVEHHRRNARKALQRVTIEVCPNPSAFLNDWVALYDVLIQRHKIRGITAFSRQSFACQMEVPGLVVFRASAESQTVGMLLWYVIGNIAYYHLGAYNEAGYKLRASFAMFWYAIHFFAEMEIEWLDLGAGAGIHETTDDGLSRFKRGWSNGTCWAYFCGRVLDREKYQNIVSQLESLSNVNYFPVYRYGDF